MDTSGWTWLQTAGLVAFAVVAYPFIKMKELVQKLR